jgi:general secretion pathway protein L
MIAYRIRVGRDTPVSGRFDWAALDSAGSVREHGSSELLPDTVAGSSCEIVLASDTVLLDEIEVPAAQQRRVSGALRFLIEDRVIPEPERLHVVAASTAGRDRLFTAAVDHQWLQSLLTRLQRAGLAPRSAVPECLLAPFTPGAWTVVWNGSESFARTGELAGFALDAMQDGTPPAALRLALENARPE